MHALPTRINKQRFLDGRALLLAAAIFSAGYGENTMAEPKTHTIVIEAMQFAPQVLEVSPGDTVVWVNKDAFPHDATATNRSFRSKEIAPNGSWKFKPVRKGTFPYLCTLHPTMKGSLIVK
jgi:plastocyanin